MAIEEKTHNYKQDKDGSWYLPVNLRKQGVDSLALSSSEKLSDRYYPIYYDPKTGRVSSIKKHEVEIWPIDAKSQKRIWRRGKEDIDKMYQNGDLWYKNTKQGDQIYFKFRGGLDGEPPESIWFDSRFSASEHGTQMLDKIFSKREVFPFPKSPYAVAECIKVASPNKNAVILDFFAGSGTTAQAVLELNASDDGYRTFILCTNNENNICDEVCYPRVSNVIKGYKFQGKDKHILYENKLTFSKLKNIEGIIEDIERIIEETQKEFDEIESKIEDNTIKIIGTKNISDRKDGLGGNLKYFKTDFVDAEPTDKNKKKLTDQATVMLCVREGTFEKVLERENFKIFKNSSHYTGIIFDQLAISEFKKAINDIKGKFSVYVFSLGDDTFDEEFEDIKQKVRLSPIPEAILRVYRRIFK